MRRITVRSPGRVLVSPTDFGWGSIGKLWLILDKLHDRDVVMNEVSNTANSSPRSSAVVAGSMLNPALRGRPWHW